MPYGQELGDLPLVGEAERVAHGDARLLHRDVASAGNPITSPAA